MLSRGQGRSAGFSRMPWDSAEAQAFDKAQWSSSPLAKPVSAANEDKAPATAEPGDAPSPSSAQAHTPAAGDAPHEGASAGQQPHAEPGAGAPTAAHSATAAATAPAPAPLQVADEAALAQQLKMAQQQGYVQGLKDGMVRALADLEAERQQDKAAIEAILHQLQALLKDTDKLFEPLKRLSLHIAEQWVRGELSVSSQVIDRLLQEALSQLGKVDAVVIASLNPDDFKRLECVKLSSQPQIQLESDDNLRPGSVRIRANDTEIQDLIEHRVENMARKLLKQPEAWLQQSALIHPEKASPVEVVETTETIPAWARPAADVHEVDVKEIADDDNDTGNDTSTLPEDAP